MKRGNRNNTFQQPDKPDLSDITFQRVVVLCLAVLFALTASPLIIQAQDNSNAPRNLLDDTYDRSIDEGESVSESARDMSEDVQLSGMQSEISEDFGDLNLESELSVGETEITPGELVSEPEESNLPGMEEAFETSPAEPERLLRLRPKDEFYEKVVREARPPDITKLGPLPEMKEEGVEFTDVAADWIYYQKSTGMTELKGHVMVVYDTTIISSDEALLNEKDKVYRFFGEGRVFVDDSDFTLECDELEIHDADDQKMIYIKGPSTLVIFADKDMEQPGKDSTRRERLNYALRQQDTTITFTNAEYNYDKDIFDAHGGVRFEQSDKYAKGDEFHGENETEYVLFKGNCEFWQKDGEWLYKYKIVEDKETPPRRADKIQRALLSVPTTITCDEFEGSSKEGWLQLRSTGGNVVYFKQDDKHAECETFSLWFKEEEPKPEESKEEDKSGEIPEQKENQKSKPEIPPGYGSLPLVTDFPPGYLPYDINLAKPAEEMQKSTYKEDVGLNVTSDTLEQKDSKPAEPTREETALPIQPPEDPYAFKDRAEYLMEWLHGFGPEKEFPASTGGNETEVVKKTDGQEQKFKFDFPKGETDEPKGLVGSLGDLGESLSIVTSEEAVQESTPRGNEILMEGNVFFRQENGNWLFQYDIVREEEESKEAIKQYRKWANAWADKVHIWMDDDLGEATGNVKGEQDNQDLTADFARYVGKFDMLYLKGNVVVHREGKHQLTCNEGFVFFSTKIFEALGNVEAKVTVDAEKRKIVTAEDEESEQTESGNQEQPPG